MTMDILNHTLGSFECSKGAKKVKFGYFTTFWQSSPKTVGYFVICIKPLGGHIAHLSIDGFY